MKNRIKELEELIFLLEMKDHWTREDFDQMAEWKLELKILKEKEGK